jgi:hypothetical protein
MYFENKQIKIKIAVKLWVEVPEDSCKPKGWEGYNHGSRCCTVVLKHVGTFTRDFRSELTMQLKNFMENPITTILDAQFPDFDHSTYNPHSTEYMDIEWFKFSFQQNCSNYFNDNICAECENDHELLYHKCVCKNKKTVDL